MDRCGGLFSYSTNDEVEENSKVPRISWYICYNLFERKSNIWGSGKEIKFDD
ncbi:hypothetical protein BACCIP111895_04687 [Neobacillus rhizosphaerae]|uniref:Uncharacterized protein n=1 Tax=Neobacillus rhizosphaerae TaxID=2880965 RepID=A0ABM9EXP9_9BACI|nr:hypothetical protein BACCIP111895_04687 [Neobacillus rhizosphaerae]